MSTDQYGIYNSIKKLLPTDSGWVVIHSSLYQIEFSETISKWSFAKAIKQLVLDGYTLAFPSFTFSFAQTGVFDKALNRSETGVLSDWVYDLYGAYRTSHPIYSHVIIGPECDQAKALKGASCFGGGSIYELFHRKNATIVMMGCGWEFCTPFHYAEERHQVPYRYYKTFLSKDDSSLNAVMYVRDLALNPRNDFMPAVDSLRNRSLIRTTPLARGIMESTSFEDLTSDCASLLSQNPYCFLKEPLRVEKLIGDAQEAENKRLVVALLGDSNIDPMAACFSNLAPSIVSGYQVEIRSCEYGQLYLDVASGKFAGGELDYAFLVSRLEDIYQVSSLDLVDLSRYEPLDRYLNVVASIAELCHRKVFVHEFYLTSGLSSGAVYINQSTSVLEFVNEANRRLHKRVAGLNNVSVLSPIAMANEPLNNDPRLWYLGRIPFSEDINRDFVSAYCGLILNDTGATARLLAVDLDNTLWGGVLGEDGVRGIHLGGDFPGNAFKDFQQTLLNLKARGIALALVSKNDQDMVLEAVASHPDMLIKESDLAAYKINWDEKTLNIKAMCEELSLGLRNVIFIDDNPVECEKVRQNLPEVEVLELPDDPSLFSQYLLKMPKLGLAELTAEDRTRADSYVVSRVLKSKNGFKEINEFYADLNIVLTIASLSDQNFSRTLQLINKTNQFNATTKRYDEKVLQLLGESDDWFVGVIGYRDKMTEAENIGVFILQIDSADIRIDSFLLSCRVLGRGIETGALNWIFNYAKAQGCKSVVGEVYPTPRNTPVQDLYQKSNFTLNNESTSWVKSVDDVVEKPLWLNIEE